MATVEFWFFFRVNVQLPKLQITTATIIYSFKICISSVRIIFIASFHSRIKVNSTNWPAPSVWVFNAEAIGSNPFEVPIFLGGFICNCFKLQWPQSLLNSLLTKLKKSLRTSPETIPTSNVSLSVHNSFLYKLKVLSETCYAGWKV